MMIVDELRGAVRGTAVAAWWHVEPGRDTLELDQVAKASDGTQGLVDHIWPSFVSILVATAAAGVAATINELIRRRDSDGGALDVAAIVEMLERLPDEVIHTAEISIDHDAERK